MAVLQDININVYAQPSEKRLRTFLTLSQNENGRLINFRILGAPLPSNCTATFSGTKPDGNVYSTTGTVTGNFVVVAEDMQMTAVAGVWDAKLDIINGTHNIMTALIRVVVDADVVDPDAIASDSQLQGLVAEAKYYAEEARIESFGAPLTAALKEDMLDKTRVYVYTGSESGMTAGHWYYWSGSAWTDGGVYNAAALDTDKTLSVTDKAADGKATGDALALKVDKVTGKGLSTNDYTTAEKTKLSGIAEGATKVEIDSTLSTAGKAADAKKTGDEISQLKSEITDKSDTADMLKAFPTDTASGSVASFADGANVPVKSLIVNIDPVQSGSGDPSPTNIRPISGWTGAVVSVSGHNLFDKTKATPNSAINSQGIVASGSYYVSDFIPVKPDTDYYIKNVEVSIHARSLCFYGVDKSFISAESVSVGDSVHAASFSKHIPSNVYYIRIIVHPDYIDSAGVNYPSTDTDYHSYGGNTYTIQLGQTVYGGKLDVVSGELVIDRAMVDLGSLNWQYSAAGTDHERFTYADPKLLKGSVCLCDRLQTVTYSDMYNHIIDNSIAAHPNAQQVEAYVSAYTDVNSFRSAMTGSQFCYKLATPLTIQLDPHEVTALLGSNNVWADSGDSEVVYRADPTLYIQRLTEPDADMVADANITSGQYFMVGNTLYKATANIASGGAITPNVNCTRKSLSEALNELNA